MKRIYRPRKNVTLYVQLFALLIILHACKKDEAKPVPSITSISPGAGVSGMLVSIAGANFDQTLTNNTVKFNGISAIVTAATANSITTSIPDGAASGKITVTTAGGLTTSTVDFKIFGSPTITSFTPTSGVAGNTITITGTNFDAFESTNNVVRFNGIQATVTDATATHLTVIVPQGATTGILSVTVHTITANSMNNFTGYTAPTITSFAPASGIAGSTVTITGINFDTNPANNQVKFNGMDATVTLATATTLTVTVPANATSGIITVTTHGITANSSTDFTVYAAPTITSFAPSAGMIGNTVIITGTNFDTTPANNLIKFNGVVATVTQATATSLTLTVPVNATSGAINVTTHTLTGVSANSFWIVPNMQNVLSEFVAGTKPVVENFNNNLPYSLGYEFVPKINATIISLGMAAPVSGTYKVQLFDKTTQTLLASADVVYSFNASNPYAFAYSGLAVPVALTASKSYYVIYSTHDNLTNIYRVNGQVMPIDLANNQIKITNGVFGAPLTIPSTNTGGTIYMADIKFTH